MPKFYKTHLFHSNKTVSKAAPIKVWPRILFQIFLQKFRQKFPSIPAVLFLTTGLGFIFFALPIQSRASDRTWWSCSFLFEKWSQSQKVRTLKRALNENLKEHSWPLSGGEKKAVRVPTSDEKARYSTDIFQLVGVIPGINGGNRLLFQTSALWFDFRKDFSEQGGDLITDPRVYQSLLGKKGAWFFGFRAIDAFHFTVPDRQELNGALDAYNRALPSSDRRRLEFRFFESEKGLPGYATNVEKFAKQKSLPCGYGGRMFLHDMTLHALSEFFIPREIEENLYTNLNRWLKFVEQVFNSNNESETIFENESTGEQNQIEILQTIRGVTALFSDQIDSMGMSRRPLMANDLLDQLHFFTRESLKLWTLRGSEVFGNEFDGSPERFRGILPGNLKGAFEAGIQISEFSLAFDQEGRLIASYLEKNDRLRKAWIEYLSHFKHSPQGSQNVLGNSRHERENLDGSAAKRSLEWVMEDFILLQSQMQLLQNQKEARQVMKKNRYSQLFIERLEYLEYLVSLKE